MSDVPADIAALLPANAARHNVAVPAGKLKSALDLLIWGDPETLRPVPWPEAARRASLSIQTMRKHLANPAVRRYLTLERQVFAASVSAQNIGRAVAIRDQDENRTAALQAVRWIEEVASGRAASEAGRVSAPGIVINIGAAAVPRSMPADDALIEINPIGDAPEV
jgi:hypothetical protein